jgi:hypothetical protein
VRRVVTGGRRDKVYEVVDKLTRTWRSTSFLGSSLGDGVSGFGVVCHASDLELTSKRESLANVLCAMCMRGIAPHRVLAYHFGFVEGRESR